MPFLILSILIQVAFVIHVVKTGRNTTWIWIIVMLPMAGSITYLLLEVLPDLGNTRAGRKASNKVQSTLNPNKDINAALKQFSIADTIENSKRLAEESYKKGLYSDSKALFQKCLKGPYSDDPDLLFGLAKAEFELCNHSNVKDTLNQLIEKKPEYKNQDAHLLYARTLEALGEFSEASHEYETLYGYYAGPDASFYYARFLRKQGSSANASEIFRQIVEKSGRSSKHYNEIHKDILKQVKLELAS